MKEHYTIDEGQRERNLREMNVVQFSRIKNSWDEVWSEHTWEGMLERAYEVGVTNAEGPPVPIPNTEVKLCSGDNTSREAAREDSSMLT